MVSIFIIASLALMKVHTCTLRCVFVQATEQIKNLYEMFMSVDATQVEINPFGETPEGRGKERGCGQGGHHIKGRRRIWEILWVGWAMWGRITRHRRSNLSVSFTMAIGPLVDMMALLYNSCFIL